MEIIECKCYIHLLDLTRNSCEKCNYMSSGSNRPVALSIFSIHTKPFKFLSCKCSSLIANDSKEMKSNEELFLILEHTT